MELGQALFGNPTSELDAPDWIADDLYALSERLGTTNPDAQHHGLFGGAWGYGQEFRNDVFEMHPYEWGDCDCGFESRDWVWSTEHDHANTCYQSILRDRLIAAGGTADSLGYVELEHNARETITRALCAEMHPSYPAGSFVHCTCTHDNDYRVWREANNHDARCCVARPNFAHFASGLEVRWYKYIGRSMTWTRHLSRSEWRRVHQDCMESVASR